MKKYAVYVDDNFHYMDPDERYKAGEYETLEEAIKVCEKIVDESLEEFYVPGMSNSELTSQYCFFGEDPWISGPGNIPFHGRDYARERADKLTNTLK